MAPLQASPRYTPVEKTDFYDNMSSSSQNSHADSLEGLLGESDVQRLRETRKANLFWKTAPWVLHGILLTVSCGLLLLAVKHEANAQTRCVEKVSTYCEFTGAACSTTLKVVRRGLIVP
jgi:hypothetical protein